MTKRWLTMLLAVLMLCVLVGCGDEAQSDNTDTATTTTATQAEQVSAPLTIIAGKIPADSLCCIDSTAPTQNHAVLLKANIDLIDLHFVALNPDPPTVGATIHTMTSVVKGQHAVFYTYINDAVPNRGVMCTDQNGKTYYYAITWSGRDGSINLTEIKE